MAKKIKEFPANPRRITEDALELLGKSLVEFGSLDGFVVNTSKGRYKDAVISGNQKNKHIGLSTANVVIEERFDPPTHTGTVAVGYVLYEGERFPYREVSWDDERCEVANIRANNSGGENDVALLAKFSEDVLSTAGINLEYEKAFQKFQEVFFDTSSGGFSEKNKEVNVGEYADEMTIKLTFTAAQYWNVKEKLAKIAETPEEAILMLLNDE